MSSKSADRAEFTPHCYRCHWLFIKLKHALFPLVLTTYVSCNFMWICQALHSYSRRFQAHNQDKILLLSLFLSTLPGQRLLIYLLCVSPLRYAECSQKSSVIFLCVHAPCCSHSFFMKVSLSLSNSCALFVLSTLSVVINFFCPSFCPVQFQQVWVLSLLPVLHFFPYQSLCKRSKGHKCQKNKIVHFGE